MIFISVHLIAAILAIVLGVTNLVAEKGTLKHRAIGWSWLIIMIFVTVSSFWIRDINEGHFSWLHLLTLWTIFSMAVAIISIKKGNVRAHARFMTGTIIGAIVAGVFALKPGRFISEILGFGSL